MNPDAPALPALLLGLLLFLGLHSLRIFAPAWRDAQLARLGEARWKGLYSLAALAGFLLILWGYAQARLLYAPLWPAPAGLRHAVALLMLPAFWLMAAAYVPRNHLRARLQHPMTLSVKLWAFAHLLVNNSLPDLLLFGGFLAWSVLLFRSARRRAPSPSSPSSPSSPTSATPAGTLLTLGVGTAGYGFFAFWLHGAWLGVRPFGV